VRTISAIVLLTVFGCAKGQPPPEKPNMTQKEPQTSSKDEVTIDMLFLLEAVPINEMPQLLQDRVKQKPPAISVRDVKALDPDERASVLAVVERAVAHYRKEARQHRTPNNPPARTADDLEAFLKAARE
jgi:hypothetical protein